MCQKDSGGRSSPIRTLHEVLALALLIVLPNTTLGQTLTPITMPQDGFSAVPIFEDSVGTRYATQVSVHFNSQVFNLPPGQRTADPNSSSSSAVAALFDDLEAEHGTITLEKVAPDAVWGQTTSTNIRTGDPCTIEDFSQLFTVKFPAPVPLDDVVADFEALAEVEYAQQPYVQVSLGHAAPRSSNPFDDPDDPQRPSQYNLDKVQADRAWDLARGIFAEGTIQAEPVGIALSDQFGCGLVGSNMHPDLRNQLTIEQCIGGPGIDARHGHWVAGVAGAETDNNSFLSSLGWNVDLYGFHTNPDSVVVLALEAVSEDSSLYGKIDVVNISWAPTTPPGLDLKVGKAVKSLLGCGVVVVAAAGNSQLCSSGPNCFCSGTACARFIYPAAHNFDDFVDGNDMRYSAQVIAVSATDSLDEFEEDFFYSAGMNPIDNPTTSYIDVAAPGVRVPLLETVFNPTTMTSTFSTRSDFSGTSFAAPLVAAQAALLLSLDTTLTVPEVYDLITRSADKVDQNEHPDMSFTAPDGETVGWNQFTGYGRINAFQALKRMLTQRGGRPRADLVIPKDSTWSFEDVTVEFAPSAELVVAGTANADGTTFAAADAGQPWGGVVAYQGGTLDLDGATVSDADIGVAVYGTDVTIAGSTIRDNRVGIESGTQQTLAAELAARSAFTLIDSSVETNEEEGIRALSTNAIITDTEITGNGTGGSGLQHIGIGVSDATLAPFRDNIIERSGSYGIAVTSGGDVQMSGTGPNQFGENRVAANGAAELFVHTGGSAFLGNSNLNGRNSVYHGDLATGPGPLVVNNSGTSIGAVNTYWGTTNPNDDPTSRFSTSATNPPSPLVVWDPLSTCDYTTNPPSGNCGSSRPGAGSGLASARQATSVSSRGSSPGSPESFGDGTLVGEIRAVRAALVAAPTAEAAPALVRTLGALHRRDRDGGGPDATGEWAESAALLGTLRSTLAAPELLPRERATAEAALEVETLAAMAHETYPEAEALVTGWGPRAESAAARHVLRMTEAHLAARDGRFTEAALLIEAEANREDDPEIAAVLQTLAATYARRDGNGAAGRPEGATVQASTHGLPAKPSLEVWPNPTTRQATVAVSVPAQSALQIEVFDVLGRRVAVLHGAEAPAGRHQLALPTAALPSGIYLVRATLERKGGAEALTKRLTVLH